MEQTEITHKKGDRNEENQSGSAGLLRFQAARFAESENRFQTA
ncbi:Uncharacterized protein dnm_021910 [Desulfonema magnum]|uniref:Uncharacterized protein n=1 Tax=Desulfonema magnum TaxID=45655 RepID=A0A975BJD6_9BACT|nr:Uncharacterized protein dnm_021910 [Desulfonema magnum]